MIVKNNMEYFLLYDIFHTAGFQEGKASDDAPGRTSYIPLTKLTCVIYKLKVMLSRTS